MSILASVTKGKVNKPPIILVHGKPGTGKSTWASQAPNPLFISFEEGTNHLDVARTPTVEDWIKVINIIGELINDEHDFKTVVFDTVDMMEMLIWKAICQRENVKSIELAGGGYGKGYKIALEEYWSVLVDGMRALRDRRNIGTILLAHSVDREIATAQTESYLRSEPKLHASSSGKIDVADYLISHTDATGFFTFKVDTVEGADKRQIAKGGKKRIQNWHPDAAHLAKNRYGITSSLPLEEGTGFADFVAAWKV